MLLFRLIYPNFASIGRKMIDDQVGDEPKEPPETLPKPILQEESDELKE